MKVKMLVALLIAGVALSSASARGEVVDLRSGITLVGEVRVEGKYKIFVESHFPEEKSLELTPDDLTPESLYRVLERRIDPKNPVQHKELAEIAERVDLKGMAIAEYRAVKRLDPSTASGMDAHIARLTEGIAADILDDAKQLLESGSPRAGVMYLHSILELYPQTRAVAQARQLMNKAHETAGPGLDVNTSTVSTTAAPKQLELSLSHMKKGDNASRGLSGHVSSSVASQRKGEAAIRHYEAAWTAAKHLPTATGNEDLQGEIEGARTRAKSSLVQAYLTTGTVLIQRRSIPAAERYCNLACELDPENKEGHELHRLILQAKLSTSASYGVYGSG